MRNVINTELQKNQVQNRPKKALRSCSAYIIPASKCLECNKQYFTMRYVSEKPYLKLETIKLLPYCTLAIATCIIMEGRIIP